MEMDIAIKKGNQLRIQYDNTNYQRTFKDGVIKNGVGYFVHGEKRYEGEWQNDKRQGILKSSHLEIFINSKFHEMIFFCRLRNELFEWCYIQRYFCR